MLSRLRDLSCKHLSVTQNKGNVPTAVHITYSAGKRFSNLWLKESRNLGYNSYKAKQIVYNND